MTHVIVGLGNPGIEYEQTRHNTGRNTVDAFRRTMHFPEWKEDKKRGALISSGAIGKFAVTLILPQLFMNKSGIPLRPLITNKKKAEKLIVVYDELDLGLGNFKISFGRSSGGHRGIESIIRSIKTKDFIRVRVGISPATPSGKVKKPSGEKKVLDFLMGSFTQKERDTLTRLSKKIIAALVAIVEEGRVQAMNEFN